jgi:uncharacterized protein GlcG (DUF336 family)
MLVSDCRKRDRVLRSVSHLFIAALTGFVGLTALLASPAQAANCMVDHDQLARALKQSVKPSGGPSNGGLDNNEWAVIVARDGTICAIAFSGNTVDDQWPASRAIAAEKANTADGMSTAKFALSTANLYAASQPGGYLFGAAISNPPDPAALYAGNAATYGTPGDPLVGKHLGGVIVFGGGLALYDASGVVGALGVSGDTACADQNIAWRMREKLGLNRVPAGVSPKHNDAIIYDIGTDGKSASGFGHPTCGGKEVDIAKELGAGFASSQAR